jgi:hypothetical protein
MELDLAQLPLAQPPNTRGPHDWSPLSIPAGVPSEGVLLRFWINFRFPNSVPMSEGGKSSPPSRATMLGKARLHLGGPLVSQQVLFMTDSLAAIHLRHGANTIGLGIVFQGLLL